MGADGSIDKSGEDAKNVGSHDESEVGSDFEAGRGIGRDTSLGAEAILSETSGSLEICICAKVGSGDSSLRSTF